MKPMQQTNVKVSVNCQAVLVVVYSLVTLLKQQRRVSFILCYNENNSKRYILVESRKRHKEQDNYGNQISKLLKR